MNGQAVPAGWYPDGVTPGVLRWFDGAVWTAHTSSGPPLPPSPMPPSADPYATPVDRQYAPSRTGGTIEQYSTAAGYERFVAPGDTSGPRDVLHWIVPVGRSWQSVTAGYVGLISLLVWVLGPVAIVLGALGMRRARHGGHGRGRSVFAIITGALATMALVAAGISTLLA